MLTPCGRQYKALEHKWDVTWAPCEEEGQRHLSVLHLLHYMTLFGYHLPLLDFRVVATQIGPGLVYLTWTSLFGTGVFIQSLKPEEPLQQARREAGRLWAKMIVSSHWLARQVLTHRVYCDFSVPTFIAKSLMAGEAMQVERDVMVWNHKRYRAKPILPKEDHLIAKHRRWYSQFYSESSPRLDDPASLDW